MNREIKFRAWDTNSKQMVMNGLWYSKEKGIDINKLMQYTGLKDKNGIEIYEGDIIHYDTDNETYKVAFDGGSYVWEGDGCYDNLIELYPSLNTKVIGNIYENPELLKGK